MPACAGAPAASSSATASTAAQHHAADPASPNTRAKMRSTSRACIPRSDRPVDRSRRDPARDLRIGQQVGRGSCGASGLPERRPGRHRVALHDAIGVLARDAGAGQRQQHLAGMHHAAQRSRGWPPSARDRSAAASIMPASRARAKSSVTRRVRRDHPLDAGVADVALVPQRHVLQRRDQRRARTRRARPVRFSLSTGLRLCGIARAALLAGVEELLRLAHLAALQVPHLGRQPLDARWRSTPSVQKNAAWRSRGITWVETGSTARPEPRGDMRLHARIDMGEGADRAAEMAQAAISARARSQPGAVAGELGVVAGELEAEAGRLGMDAVAAADGERVLVLERAPLQRRQHARRGRPAAGRPPASSCTERQVSSTSLLVMPRWTKRLSGPIASASQVRKAITSCRVSRSIASMRSRSAARDAASVAPPRSRMAAAALLGDAAERGHRLGGQGLDLEPDAEAVLRRPDGGHLRGGCSGEPWLLRCLGHAAGYCRQYDPAAAAATQGAA